MLVITGWGSKIAEELRGLIGWTHRGGDDYPLEREEDIKRATYDAMPLDADRYFLCAGLLLPKTLEEMTSDDYVQTMAVNFSYPMGACEDVLAANDSARICVMGSESGFTGSYNMPYASAKRTLHKYVETKELRPMQQLVCVAPGIVGDAGMTLRRTDLDVLESRRTGHPKGRFVTSLEVARLVRFLLYEDEGYVSNTVIRMNGGENTR